MSVRSRATDRIVTTDITSSNDEGTGRRGAAGGAPSRGSLAEHAYRQLKDGILDNTYPPGFTATEAEIAARLAMSRTPLREALLVRAMVWSGPALTAGG